MVNINNDRFSKGLSIVLIDFISVRVWFERVKRGSLAISHGEMELKINLNYLVEMIEDSVFLIRQ